MSELSKSRRKNLGTTQVPVRSVGMLLEWTWEQKLTGMLGRKEVHEPGLGRAGAGEDWGVSL